jgi:leucyl aminopeptidase
MSMPKTRLTFYRTQDNAADFNAEVDEVNVRTEGDILTICCGCGETATAAIVSKTVAYGIQRAEYLNWPTLSIIIPDWFDKSLTIACVEGIVLGSYKFDQYKTKKYHHLSTIEIITDKITDNELKESLIVCQCTNYARDLVNRNAKDKHPDIFANYIKNELTTIGLDVKILPDELMSRFGLIQAVAEGSPYPARIVTIQYTGNKSSTSSIALVGKGIIFDTGGVALKEFESIRTMRKDVAGAAAVIGVMKAIALLKLPVNIVGVLPLTYNSIDGRSYLPGDVYTSYSGKTVEIDNTDAEGRLILADAVSYCVEKFKPTVLVDLATLTKTILNIFGKSAAGLFANNNQLANDLYRAGKVANERVWRLPLYPEYNKSVESDIADLKNSFEQQQAKSAMGASFIKQFVGNIPWAHVDMSNVAFNEDMCEEIDHSHGDLPHNATGYGVRLLYQFLKSKSQSRIAKNQAEFLKIAIGEKLKPSFFQGTKYREPTDVELLEIHKSGPTGEDLMKGFGYAMIGRGMLNSDNKAMIIRAIERLCKIQPSNKEYWGALEQAKAMSR